MPYITIPQSPIYKQITLDDLLNGTAKVGLIRSNETNTRTFFTNNPTDKYFDDAHITEAEFALMGFIEKHKALYDVEDRQLLYNRFFIPKRSGGLREINAPNPELMDALRELKTILETQCAALYHTSAFAYVKSRSTVDAVRKHQQNNSHWFLKLDLHDFFGSTSKEFVMRMLDIISPFDRINKDTLSKALDLCFLNGGLPQGTPISPMLTNLIMIPFDYEISRSLRQLYVGETKLSFVYTRYADDMQISSLHDFDKRIVVDEVKRQLENIGAPYKINDKKTHYGSRAGSNWNLGVMLNKDNNITVGHKNKKSFRAMCTNYILDYKNNVKWPVEDVQHFNGIISYYKMIEPEYFNSLISSMNTKYDVNLSALIKADLSI